ncbi:MULTISPECIES: topology modulation protein [unclassified Phenylobacterium]|uniref:topology modulation protein n=1 Tax=unclassified Phenylobacterium TaxID=2640670 RepID=UPI00083A12FF|nr:MULTISPECIES: topology modulation protein [unclassified Phenylobacterium]
MRRVLIIGNSGAGKSTLAARLGQKLGLPVIHLDVLFWKPGWVESEDDQFRARVAAALAAPAWVCDGNFPSSWDVRMPRADIIVWLDQPRWLCVFRAIRRVFQYREGERPDMAAGCRETIDLKFYHFIWTYDRKVRPKLEAALAQYGAHARVAHLRSDREIEAFLERA